MQIQSLNVEKNLQIEVGQFAVQMDNFIVFLVKNVHLIAKDISYLRESV